MPFVTLDPETVPGRFPTGYAQVLRRSRRPPAALNWRLEWVTCVGGPDSGQTAHVRLVGTKQGGRWASDPLPSDQPEIELFQQATRAADALAERLGNPHVHWRWKNGRPLLVVKYPPSWPEATFEGFEVQNGVRS